MNKVMMSILVVAGIVTGRAADEKPAEPTVEVDFSVELGPIRTVHGVCNGPVKAREDQCRGNFEAYAAARIPYARTHDANLSSAYGASHVVDISAVFPDFDKDENDPASYDFDFTDVYVSTIQSAGTETYYRLGESIEHKKGSCAKKYHVHPPKDFAKWARICEHIIRHYNEGWANGYRFNIRHWEIWCEPNNNRPDNPVCWAGTEEQFNDLFEIAARHLKSRFPTLKIGGPGTTGGIFYSARFLEAMNKRNVPFDFFSWHGYDHTPEGVVSLAKYMRACMNSNGFEKVESHMTEYNYVKGWTDEWLYSMQVETGNRRTKGSAYTMAVIAALQNETDVAVANYYDARIGSGMNGLFDNVTLQPVKGYYPFYVWSKLFDLGRQVSAQVVDAPDVRSTAAVGANGRAGVLLARFNDDDNIVTPKLVKIRRADGRSLADATAHLTDSYHTYTEVVLRKLKDGSVAIFLEPNAFVYLEFDK